MGPLSLLLLPARTAVAGAELVLSARDMLAAEGPARRSVDAIEALASPDGPLARLEQLARMTGDDQPLGRALRPGGPLDRLLEDGGAVERLIQADGPLERLLAEGGPLDRLLDDDGALDRITQPGGTLDRVLEPGGLLDRLVAEDGVAEKLLEPGGAADRLLAEDGPLEQLGDLAAAVERLGDLEQVLSLLSQRLATLPGLPEAIHAVEVEVRSVREEVIRVQPSLDTLGAVVDRIPGAKRRAKLDKPPD